MIPFSSPKSTKARLSPAAQRKLLDHDSLPASFVSADGEGGPDTLSGNGGDSSIISLLPLPAPISNLFAARSPLTGAMRPGDAAKSGFAGFSLAQQQAALVRTARFLFPIWVKYIRQTDGRDKFLKVIQYSCKVLLHSTQFAAASPDWAKQLKLLVAGLSMARKCIRLAHGLEPLAELVDAGLPSALWDTPALLGFLNNGMTVISDTADDICALAKMGVLEKTHLATFEPLSTKLSLLCNLIDLNEAAKKTFALHVEGSRLRRRRNLLQRQSHGGESDEDQYLNSGNDDDDNDDKKLRRELEQAYSAWRAKYRMQLISTAKLMGDFGYLIVDWGQWESQVGRQNVSALFSGCCAVAKLVIKAL